MRRLGPWPPLALAALVAGILAPVLSGHATFFYRDVHWVWYPWFESLARGLAEGAWPLWDPHPGFGQPALANPAYQVAYPLAWPAWVLPGHHAYAFYVLVHLWLAGFGTACLVRSWGGTRLAAAFSGALWVTSGPLLSFANLHHHLGGLCWAPWVLWAIERACQAPGRGRGVALGGVVGLQLLAGSADMVVMTALLAGLRLLLALREGPGSPPPRASLLATLVVGAAVGAAVAAAQWLPTLALVGATARVRLGAANLFWSLHPLSLLDFLASAAVAGPDLAEDVRRVVFDSREPFVPYLYLGASTVPLVALGLWRGTGPGRLLVAGGLPLFLVLALGRHTPLYPLLSELPPFSMLRYPVKYVGPLALLWATAAGLGLDAACRRWPAGAQRRVRWVVAACGLLAGLAAALAGSLASGWPGWLAAGAAQQPVVATLVRSAAALAAGSLLLALLASRSGGSALPALMACLALADLTPVARQALLLAPRALAAHRPAWVAHQAQGTRFYSRLPAGRDARLKPTPPGWSRNWWWTLGVQELIVPPIGGRWGFGGSYDGDPVGLAPQPLNWLTRAVQDGWGGPRALRLLQLGAVQLVVSLDDEGAWLGPARAFDSAFQGPVRLSTVPDTLPRALLVEGARVVEDGEALELLSRTDFDLGRWVLLASGQPRPPGPDSPGVVRVLDRRADRVALEVEARRPAHLLLVETWEAGWLAWLDGVPVPVQRANLLFRAVAVPAGRHRVEMRYRPRAAVLGGIVTATALLGLALRLPLRRRS